MLTGCERSLLSPIKDIPNHQKTNTQFAQSALLELAETATSRGFMELADAATGFAEALATEDGISVEPTFSELARFTGEVIYIENTWVNAGCSIELGTLAQASVDAIRAYTIRDPSDMEQTLQNLAQEAETAETALQQLPAQNTFTPFAFGGGSLSRKGLVYQPGKIWLQYDETRPVPKTKATVVEFLALKGYKATVFPESDVIHLDATVDPLLIVGELSNIPGVALARGIPIEPQHEPQIAIPPDANFGIVSGILHSVWERYTKAFCQGNLGVIDTILTEESGLDFFDFSFVRSLVKIYEEEVPEAAEHIRTNRFRSVSIVRPFLVIYFQNSERPLDEIIAQFRQSIRNKPWGIPPSGRTVYYYYYTNYWGQFVTDHLNK